MPKKPRVALNVRLPPKLHAQLVRAAKREGHSLNDEILLRASVRPTAVMDLLDRLELDFRDALQEAAATCKAVADEAIRGAFVKMLHKIENGDLPMLQEVSYGDQSEKGPQNPAAPAAGRDVRPA